MNGASQIFFGQYASQKLLPNQILSYFDVISYCEKKLGTHVSNFFDGVDTSCEVCLIPVAAKSQAQNV